MATKERSGGTLVHTPGTGEERIAAIRSIVERKQYAKVDGCMVDLFSASAIVQVYDAINPTQQERYRNMKAPQMASVAFKLLK